MLNKWRDMGSFTPQHVSEVNAFHGEMLTYFVIDDACKGVSLVHYLHGQSGAELKNDMDAFRRSDWELNLAFDADAHMQEWSLWHRHNGNLDPVTVFTGKGNPQQTVHQVCTVMARAAERLGF